MATTLSYTLSAFTPFTVIRSADMNQYFNDIKSRVNWAGGSSTTTGLGDDNLQSNTVSGGALTRATKLKLGTAKAFVANSSTGALVDIASAANQTLYTNASGNQTAGTLPILNGGTGISVVAANQQPGDVFQINALGTAIELSAPTASPTVTRIYAFYNLA